MAEVFLRNGRVSTQAASQLASMFASLAEDAGEAVSIDVTIGGGAAFVRRDGANPDVGEPVTVSAVLAEMAGLAAQIEGVVAEEAADAADAAAPLPAGKG